jgi:hypothetical protein
MKMFEQKTLVLNFEIYNSNTSLWLWSANHFPRGQRVCLTSWSL